MRNNLYQWCFWRLGDFSIRGILFSRVPSDRYVKIEIWSVIFRGVKRKYINRERERERERARERER